VAHPVSRVEAVFVDAAAEPVAPLPGDGWWAHGTEPLLGWLECGEIQRAAWPMGVVVADEGSKHTLDARSKIGEAA
jgi:hypothetical protein